MRRLRTCLTLRPGRSFVRAVAVLALLTAAPALQAQQAGSLRSPILTVDSARLFTDSALGKRLAALVEQEGADLAAENRRIEAELVTEEQALTDKRAATDPGAFRDLADAFDEKVRRIRREQEGKARALNQANETARRTFLTRAQPALEILMQDIGAAVILEQRSVFLAAGVIDITDEAIRLIDARNPPENDPALETAPADSPPETAAPDRVGGTLPAAPGPSQQP